jgi:hypothetical protein
VSRPDLPTLVALIAALVLRPLLYTVIDAVGGSGGQWSWWLFHGWILLGARASSRHARLLIAHDGHP